MTALQELGAEISLTSETITYKPSPGKVTITRPRDQLLKVGEESGLTFAEHQGGVISAPTYFDGDGEPMIIDFWDERGRICKQEFRETGKAAKTFTNLYEFDGNGRLIIFKQMIKEKGKPEKLYTLEEYQYKKDRPDEQYIATYTDQKGNVETWNWKERKQDLRTDIGKTYKA